MFNLGTMVGRGKDAGPYIGWNNPDVSGRTYYTRDLASRLMRLHPASCTPQILEVGVVRKGMTPLTVVEAQTHFALWCVTSSPLLLSMELVGGNSGTPTWLKMMEIVQNKDAIWVNREI